MRRMWILFACIVVFTLIVNLSDANATRYKASPADTAAHEDAKEKKKKSRSYADQIRNRFRKPAPEPEKKPKYKKWDDVIKESDILEGLFKVYTKKEDVFFEIRKDQLDTPMLAVLSLSKGIGARRILGGMPIDDIMFDFHRTTDHVQVRRLNTRFRAGEDPALEKAIDLTYGSSILFSLPIESEHDANGALLVKMNEVFLSDLPDIGFFMSVMLRKPVRMDQEKGFYNTIKVFPKNVEIDVRLTYTPGDRRGLSLPTVPDSRYIEIGVHYSINVLPEKPMNPRLADDRVGYFTKAYKDFTRDDKDSYMVHYITRWRLEKKDSLAALSEVKGPIVFYIDHTVPYHYRKYVRDGIEEWQKAFEEAGFKNAIVARDPPDTSAFDPEDARYNTIRWIVSDVPSFAAIGPSRIDPRTGEILDADILIEGSYLAHARQGYRRYIGPDAVYKLDPFIRLIDRAINAPGVEIEDEPAVEFFKDSRWYCDIGRGMAEEAAFTRLVMLGNGEIEAGMDVPEEFIGETLKETVIHEVGHTLGLRHNFRSSVAMPYDKLNDREYVEQVGITGSIMDYSPANVARDRSRQGYYYSPTIGPYDRWAIKWGYMPVPGATPENEAELLREIAKDAYKTENTYGTDEDTYPLGALDPYCTIWDLGDDPLQYAIDRMAIVNDLLMNDKLEGRLLREGDDYSPLLSGVATLFLHHYIAVGHAIKYVGGQFTTRAHMGDPGGQLPFEPVPPEKQREALQFIIKNGFSPDAFAIPPELLNRMVSSKHIDWQNNLFSFGRRFDFPLHNWVERLQYSILLRLTQPLALQRILEAEYKVDDPFRLSELISTLSDAIWLDTPVAKGRTAAMRRALQRNYVALLTHWMLNPPAAVPHEATALARLNLMRIQGEIEEAFKTANLGDEANAHLIEMKARIDRALDAKLEARF